jgi:glycosyltransferase involved in cell wall biosynthesis
MNILHIVMSDSFAGIEQHVNELAGVQKNNSNISLIVSSNIIEKFDKHLDAKEIKNFGRGSIYNIAKLSLLIKNINPDIVHSHGTKTTQIINIVKYFTSFKHVSTIHGIKKNLNAYEKADLVIGVSSKTLSNLKVQSKVVSNWWSPLLNNNSDDKTNEYALSVGKLERVKGFDLLIKGWQNISSNLVIIGTGKEYTKLKSLISSYKLEGKIKIIDEVSQNELINLYKKASVLLVSSRNEGGPRVALEALKNKVPVLATDVGHMSDILPNEFLAKADDLNSLTKLLETYVDKIEIYDQSSIFEYVESEYCVEGKIEQIDQIYRGLLISS